METSKAMNLHYSFSHIRELSDILAGVTAQAALRNYSDEVLNKLNEVYLVALEEEKKAPRNAQFVRSTDEQKRSDGEDVGADSQAASSPEEPGRKPNQYPGL